MTLNLSQIVNGSLEFDPNFLQFLNDSYFSDASNFSGLQTYEEILNEITCNDLFLSKDNLFEDNNNVEQEQSQDLALLLNSNDILQDLFSGDKLPDNCFSSEFLCSSNQVEDLQVNRLAPIYILPKIKSCVINLERNINWYDLIEKHCALNNLSLPQDYFRPDKVGLSKNYIIIGTPRRYSFKKNSENQNNYQSPILSSIKRKRRLSIQNELDEDLVNQSRKKITRLLQINTCLYCIYCNREYQESYFFYHLLSKHNILQYENKAILNFLSSLDRNRIRKLNYRCDFCQADLKNIDEWHYHRQKYHFELITPKKRGRKSKANSNALQIIHDILGTQPFDFSNLDNKHIEIEANIE